MASSISSPIVSSHTKTESRIDIIGMNKKFEIIGIR